MNRVIYIGLFLLFGFVANAQERPLLREGNAKYEKKDFNEAEINFRKAISENQNSVTGHFNLGNSIYQQDRTDEAIAEYDLVSKSSKDKLVKADAFHNKGNALMKGKKLQEAIESYKNALRNNPKNQETRYNLALAQKMLKDQQKKDQENKDKNKDNKDNKQNKDKNKQDQNKDQNKDNKDNKENKDKQNKDQNKDNKDQKDNKKDDKKKDNKDDKKDKKDDQNKDKKDDKGDNKKDKDKDQNKDKQDKNKPDQGDKGKQQPQKGKISKDDMKRLLNALKNQENETQKKVNAKKIKGKPVKGEKDW